MCRLRFVEGLLASIAVAALLTACSAQLPGGLGIGLRDSPLSPPATPVPPPTPSPEPTSGPSDPDAWWEWPCNVRCPAYPDGCPEFERWDRAPGQPIAPPCIRIAYTEPEEDNCEGASGVRVVIVLDHPEDPDYAYPDAFATQEVHVSRCDSEGQWWTDAGPGWDYDCNKNPAPLAWAVTEALNTGSMAPFDQAYNRSLPEPFLEFIAGLMD
jgi:hypothetical protein